MRFFTSFRDLDFFLLLFEENPMRGIVILCLALAFAVGGSLIIAHKQSK